VTNHSLPPVPEQTASTGARLIPAPVLVLLSVLSLQMGAAIAKDLFAAIGPSCTVLYRAGGAAAIMLVLRRPNLRRYNLSAWLTGIAFGLSLGLMNLVFYAALARIPLGVAVTLEFIGPLGLSVVQSRSIRDLLYALLAAIGIVLLGPLGIFNGDLDPLGVAFALTAGLFWAGYIVLNARTGRVFAKDDGLIVALLTATVLTAPLGLYEGGRTLLQPMVIVEGLGVAILSSALPYSLELNALRRMSTRVFSILMATEPAIAALVGFVLLDEGISVRMVIAIVLVMIASIGVTRGDQG
jgi:inner membrane transporter RhtA